MIDGNTMHRINNVAARVVSTEDGADFYHPDCLPDKGISEEDVSIDHEYCGGDGRFTSWEDTCSGCNKELGDSGGIQPEDDEEGPTLPANFMRTYTLD